MEMRNKTWGPVKVCLQAFPSLVKASPIRYEPIVALPEYRRRRISARRAWCVVRSDPNLDQLFRTALCVGYSCRNWYEHHIGDRLFVRQCSSVSERTPDQHTTCQGAFRVKQIWQQSLSRRSRHQGSATLQLRQKRPSLIQSSDEAAPC